MVARANDPAPSPKALTAELLGDLKSHASSDNVAGMERYAISAHGTLGVSMPVVRKLASEARKRLGSRDLEAWHELAARLWASEVHEARIMAALVDAPGLVDDAQMEAWAADVDSWDVCDQLCINLWRLAPARWSKASEWTQRSEEFVKRAGFALGATLAVHEKQADDGRFLPLLAAAEREACDERNMVKKALNWQVRSIGKRSPFLNAAAVETCERILVTHPESPAARWVARDALRELRSDAVKARLGMC